MKRDETIERCTKALVRDQGYNESTWQQYPNIKDMARNVVVVLAELGLISLDK